MKLYTKFERNRTIRGGRSYCDFSVWPYDREHVLSAALVSGITFTKFDIRQLIRAWIIALVMLVRYLTVPLAFDLLTLNFSSISCVMRLNSVYTKFEPNRIIHGWVIDDLARLRVHFSGVGQNWQRFLKGAWTQLHQTWPGHRAIIAALLHFCFRIRISCCIFKCGRLKSEWCFKWRRISHFLTHLKIRKVVGEIPIPIAEALGFTYDRISEIHLMAVLCVAAVHGGLTKMKESQSTCKVIGKTWGLPD